MEELSCPYYFRISAKDEPGVLASIAGILSKHGISIESVIQKGRKQSGPVSVVMRDPYRHGSRRSGRPWRKSTPWMSSPAKRSRSASLRMKNSRDCIAS